MKGGRSRLILIISSLFFSACASVPRPATLPTLDLATLAREGTPLSVALVAAEQVTDVHSRIYAYTEIARGYIAQDSGNEALRLLDRALQLTSLANLTQDSSDIQSSVAGLLVEAGQTDRAVQLLQTALDGLNAIRDDTTKGLVLEKIISACFAAGPPAYDVLRQTVQAIYIIQDLWVRASLLVDTARRYQDAGLTQPVNILLQQAIPAAGSIASPWLKALALSEIAVRFQVSGNADSASYYAVRSIDQITSVTVVRRSEEDASRVIQVAENLATLHKSKDALSVLQTVEYAYLRAEGYAAVAQKSFADAPDSRGQALDLCSQAVDLAQSISDPYQRVEALAAVANAYGSIHQPRLALATAGVARELLPQVTNAAQRSAAVEAVSRVEIAWGEWQKVVPSVSAIGDPYYRASTMISLTDALISAKKSSAAELTLKLAEKDAAAAPFLRDNLFRSAALARIRVGDFSAAIDDIAQIQNAYPLATTLADLGRNLANAGSAGTVSSVGGVADALTVEAGDKLRTIAAELLKRSGKAPSTVAPAVPKAPVQQPANPVPQPQVPEGDQGL
ncbi:MAG TPA: hypothetical protein VMW87_08750 [Spirochaetia bacterium]|nr:hypothetical protein [Spirochaetia bacterium]